MPAGGDSSHVDRRCITGERWSPPAVSSRHGQPTAATSGDKQQRPVATGRDNPRQRIHPVDRRSPAALIGRGPPPPPTQYPAILCARPFGGAPHRHAIRTEVANYAGLGRPPYRV